MKKTKTIAEKPIKIFNTLFRFRWIIYLFVFIVCVLFKIHGSSIGFISTILTEKTNDQESSTIIGDPRGIRSDEFNVMTPYYMSQVDNDFEKYSNQMSLSGQNMVIGYHAPVKDLTTIAQPLNWGYILFGKEYGLSWYWCLKQILIFAFALECMLILTKKKKILSMVGALLIAYSPVIQWWFAPHMPDVMLWGMAVFTTAYHFLATKKHWLKNVLMIVFPITAADYCISLFPSLQVGIAIFFAIILILVLLRDKIIIFSDKKQTIRIIVSLLLLGILVGFFVLTNLDGLKASLNTVYPGHRVSTGGDYGLGDLITRLSFIFLPFKEITYSNACEQSSFLHFGLFFIMLSPFIITRLKNKKDQDYKVGIGFVAIMVVFGFFMLVGFPEWLAKITFFSYINRMDIVFGFVSVFFTIWSINALMVIKPRLEIGYYLAALAIYSFIVITTINSDILGYISKRFLAIEIMVIIVLLILLYFKNKKPAYILTTGLVIVSGFTINPLVYGISDITNHPSAHKVSEILSNDNDSYWIGLGNTGIIQNYLLALGAKAINSVNYYPDYKKWTIIDPENKYEDVWNRYAHIVVYVSEDQENHLEVIQSDAINVRLTLSTMRELNVRYVMSLDKIEENDPEYSLDVIYQDSNCYIYELTKEKQ